MTYNRCKFKTRWLILQKQSGCEYQVLTVRRTRNAAVAFMSGAAKFGIKKMIIGKELVKR